MTLDLSGRRVLVLGLGDTGLSMARWLKRHGAIVSVADTRANPPHAGELSRKLPGVELECGEFRDASVRGADLIAISPGIDRRTPAVVTAIERGTPVVGDVDLFAQALKARSTLNVSVIGAIIGEFIIGSGNAQGGLGVQIIFAQGRMYTSLLFAQVIAATLLGFLFFMLVSGIGHLLLRHWHESAAAE